MGFFNTLGKIVYGVGDFVIELGNQYAKKINRMTDEEIEKRYSKSADEVRMDAEMVQMNCEMLQMKKEEREMQAEITWMKQEQHERYKEYEGLYEYGECDDDF